MEILGLSIIDNKHKTQAQSYFSMQIFFVVMWQKHLHRQEVITSQMQAPMLLHLSNPYRECELNNKKQRTTILLSQTESPLLKICVPAQQRKQGSHECF